MRFNLVPADSFTVSFRKVCCCENCPRPAPFPRTGALLFLPWDTLFVFLSGVAPLSGSETPTSPVLSILRCRFLGSFHSSFSSVLFFQTESDCFLRRPPFAQFANSVFSTPPPPPPCHVPSSFSVSGCTSGLLISRPPPEAFMVCVFCFLRGDFSTPLSAPPGRHKTRFVPCV